MRASDQVPDNAEWNNMARIEPVINQAQMLDGMFTVTLKGLVGALYVRFDNTIWCILMADIQFQKAMSIEACPRLGTQVAS